MFCSLLKSTLNLPHSKALTDSSGSTVRLRLSFCKSHPPPPESRPRSLFCSLLHTGRPKALTETPWSPQSVTAVQGVARVAPITENKLQWALTYIFLNMLRTSPGIAELSWSISGRRRKRIWAGLARNFSLNHMARNCSMFLSWSLRIYFMHIIPWSSWCSIS